MQVHYITRNGWTPCLEFSDIDHAYISSDECVRFGTISTVSSLHPGVFALHKKLWIGASLQPVKFWILIFFFGSTLSTFSEGFLVVFQNYNDNKYWTMWKLPMFGCTDPSQVQVEIDNCIRTFPNAFLRIVGFDSIRQVQVAGFLVHRPRGASDFCEPDRRSVGW
ncbi:MAG: hypothetical protein Devi2KO_40660 [Devosia indica]